MTYFASKESAQTLPLLRELGGGSIIESINTNSMMWFQWKLVHYEMQYTINLIYGTYVKNVVLDGVIIYNLNIVLKLDYDLFRNTLHIGKRNFVQYSMSAIIQYRFYNLHIAYTCLYMCVSTFHYLVTRNSCCPISNTTLKSCANVPIM